MADSYSSLRQYQLAHIRPLADRFWEKVTKTDTCWLWTGAANHLGYGQIAQGGADSANKRLRATAVAWFLVRGEWPAPGAHICHRCDNPPCVNPDHLFLGTAKDNLRDAIAKGRFRFLKPSFGERNVNAKMTSALVVEARARHLAGERQADLARAYNVSNSTMCAILKGRIWRALGVPVAPKVIPRRVPIETKRMIVSRYREGASIRALSRMFHVDRATVKRYVTESK
jgi:hypothetical protein